MAKNSKPVPQTESKPTILSRSLTYSGPLPTASELGKYEQICQGAADRIIRMAEKQSEHRQNIETIVIKAASERSILGVKYAYRIALGAFVLSGFCFYFDHAFAGGAIFGTTLISIISAFIYGTNSNKQEREEKWDKSHNDQEQG